MKIYAINRINSRPIHFLRKSAVDKWCNYNPGECQSWHAHDVLEYVDSLWEKIDTLEGLVERLRSRLRKRTED